MTNARRLQPRPLDWTRVGAWSGSFAAHVCILLLVALPMTAPPLRHIDPTIIARWIETPPPPPIIDEPPPPTVPHHVKTTVTRTPPPPAPVTESPVEATAPTTPDLPQTTEVAASVPATTASDDIGSGHATQTLAYATPMQPRYPPAAVHAREQGTVLLRVLVDASGAPQRIEVARSSGHADLDTAARESVARARFRPVMRDGAAVAAWGLVPIEFRLDRG